MNKEINWWTKVCFPKQAEVQPLVIGYDSKYVPAIDRTVGSMYIPPLSISPSLPTSSCRMQHPTCTNTRIRSVNDAHKIFYAVQQGVLRMVTRRLDTDERMQLRSGCVYAWEERGTHTEPNGLGIERFTEGRRWSPSRVRDVCIFLFPVAELHPYI